MKLHQQVKGFYTLEVRHADGTCDRYEDIPNLITNTGLDTMGFNSPWPYSILAYGVGTSTVPPAPTDTNMPDLVASAFPTTGASAVYQTSVLPYYTTTTQLCVFAAGAYVGTIYKVGAFANNPSTTAPLFSAALLPTPITLANTDQLLVYYTLVTRIPSGAQTGFFNLQTDGVPVQYSYRATPILTSGWAPGLSSIKFSNLFAESSNAAETSIDFPTAVPANYVPGTFVQDVALSFTTAQGNYPTGISTIALFGSVYAYNVSISPPIKKSALQTLVLNLAFSWSN